MAHYVALDVSQQDTHICIVDEKNRQIWQGKCLTSPTAINDKITRHAPNPEKVGLETGNLTTWLWHELTALKLPAVVMEARHAKRALYANINKTDKNDAQGLARLLQTGFYKEVRVKGFDAHKVRASLSARATLVRTGSTSGTSCGDC